MTTDLAWNEAGSRYFETGVEKATLFTNIDPMGAAYNPVPWNGLVSIERNPTVETKEPLYLDGIKYGDTVTYKQTVGTINAYTYPDELLLYEGIETSPGGVMVGDQPSNELFWLSYETRVGNDINGVYYGKKIHLLYNVSVTPQVNETVSISEEIEPTTFSWGFDTIPMSAMGYKPISYLCLDSRKVPSGAMLELEELLYVTKTMYHPSIVLNLIDSWEPPLPTMTYPSLSTYPSSTLYPS